MSGQSFYLGIDGGGSRCRARLRDAAGQIVGEAEGGLANIYQDFDGSLRTILATAKAAAGAIALENIHAGLGLAGATGPEQCTRVLAAGLPFAAVSVDSDGCAACLGAHDGGDGGIVISGTGSAGFALFNGARISIGGHGFMLGDQGSGAIMGRALLQQALLAHDGIAPASDLTREVMAFFSGAPANMVEWSRQALSRDYAGFAPQIIAAARAGDIIARPIAMEAAAGVAHMALQLRRAGAQRLSLIGGLGPALLPFMDPDLAGWFKPALADPLDGAILLVRKIQASKQTGASGIRPSAPR